MFTSEKILQHKHKNLVAWSSQSQMAKYNHMDRRPRNGGKCSFVHILTRSKMKLEDRWCPQLHYILRYGQSVYNWYRKIRHDWRWCATCRLCWWREEAERSRSSLGKYKILLSVYATRRRSLQCWQEFLDRKKKRSGNVGRELAELLEKDIRSPRGTKL